MVEEFKPILKVICPEKNGPVTREIGLLIFTAANVKLFYEKASKYPVLFGRPIRTQEEFIKQFVFFNSHDEPELNGAFWTDKDLDCVFYLSDIYDEEASAHYTFLDGRQKGREPLVRAMLRYVFEEFGYRRLNASLPVYAVTALNFARTVGFVEEGRKRKAALWKGDYFDVILFGILRGEVLDGK